MLTWFSANLGTILVGLLLVAIVAFILHGMYRDKKRGKTSCGCGCSGCPHSGSCHGH
jgi:hypothetical protein